jgi:hypothetical protein
MYHLTDWVTNGAFSSITGWNEYEDDPPGALSRNYDAVNDWITITRTSGGKVKYDYWGSWNQSATVDEGDAVSATLNVTYQITTTTGTNGQNALPYVFVNGTVWELPTGGQRFSVNQDWQTYSIDLDPGQFSFPGDVVIAFGIRGFKDTQFQTTGVLYCDDVSLTLRTSRLSEVVSLSARDADDTVNTASFVTGAGGKGYATLTGPWTGQVSLDFMSNESGTEFQAELYVPLERITTVDTNTYTVANNTQATWSSRFFVSEMGDPFVYRYFNVSIPNDWTLVDVYDGFDILQLSGITYYNATYYSAESTLLCDISGTGVGGTPHYGIWKISSSSPNYADALSFWKGTQSIWTGSSVFYPGSDMRISAAYLDEGSNPPTTYGNGSLHLYDSEGANAYNEYNGVLNSSGIYTYQNGTGLSNITVPSDWLPGQVTAIATWTNGTSVGEIRSVFEIHHSTTIEVEAAVYEAFRGDTVSARVRYVDLETGLGIPSATLYYNWSLGSGVMGYAGGGWYAGAIDTSLATIGGYPVTVNATRMYYDFVQTTSISVEVQERTQILTHTGLRIDKTSYDIAWGNEETFYVSYDDTIAANPTTLTVNTGTLVSGDVADTYTSNNIYAEIDSVGDVVSVDIETNVTTYGVVGSDLAAIFYKLEGRFSVSGLTGSVRAYNYSSSSWVTIISDYSPSTDTTRSWRTLTPTDFISGTGIVRAQVLASHTSSFTYYVDLFDFISVRPIPDTAPDMTMTLDWTAQTVVGTQTGPTFNSSLGLWQVGLNSAGVAPGEYTITVEASATGHQAQTKVLTVLVRAHHTRVTAAPPADTPWSWKTWLNVTFEDIDNSTILLNEANISQVEVTTVYGTQVFTTADWTYGIGSGAASVGFWLDTSGWAVGNYDATIVVTTAGTGLDTYFDDGTTSLPITVRAHDIRVTVSPPQETPWSWRTSTSVTISDLDNSSITVNPGNVSSITIAGQTFTSADWSYSAGTFTVLLDTSAWGIGSILYDVDVATAGGPKVFMDGSSNVRVTIRSHNIGVVVTPPGPVAWGQNITIVVEVRDLDNASIIVPEGNLTSLVIGSETFTSSDWSYSVSAYAQLTVTFPTDDWSIGGPTPVSVDLSTSGSGPSKFYLDGSSSVSITVRSHLLLLTVSPPGEVPWGSDTIVLVVIRDLDDPSRIVPENNLTSLQIDTEFFTSATWTYSVGTYAQLTATLTTDSWAVGSYPTLAIVLSTTGAGPTKYFEGATSSVDVTIRAHNVASSFLPIQSTPWGQSTTLSIQLNDLDNGTNTVPESQISYVNVTNVIFTSANWTYVSGTISMILDTSQYAIGTWPKTIDVIFVGGTKNYTDTSTSGAIIITSHTIGVEATRPAATPWSENTTITIRILDISDGSIIISSDNVTQININGQIFTTWVYDNGNFTIELDTDSWAVGIFSSLVVQVTTSGSGVTKYFKDGSTTVTVEIRERYSEAYSPAPDPVPLQDDLIFFVTFRDRDSGGAQVDFTDIYLNDTDYTLGVDFTVTWISLGYYRITFDTTSLGVGEHILNVIGVEANYENATTVVRFTVRLIDTEAVASGYSFSIPLGADASFTITFTDVDHSLDILGATFVHNWTASVTITDVDSNGVYEIVLETLDSTPLGTYSVRFNISKANYEDAFVRITIKVKTHSTFLSLDDPVLPTATTDNISVALFYEDIDLSEGISNSSGNIIVTLWNDLTSDFSALFYVEDNTGLGTGHYFVLIPASQFGGLYTISFTVYFNWTGDPKFLNLTKTFSVELTGADSALSVIVAPQAVYYGQWINFTLYFEDVGAQTGILNNTENVWAAAEMITAGQSISPSDFIITNQTNGRYQFLLNSSLLTSHGSFVIRTFLNWSQGVIPFYQNRTLDITVTVLVRLTLIDLIPPQNTAYDEDATFTFTYFDSASNTLIANSSQLFVQINNGSVVYVKAYNTGTKVWTITVDTSSLPSTGAFALELNVTWVGSPFYQNQTRYVSLTVTARPTQLTYEAPVPPYFNSNVTLQFSYWDLIDDSTVNMDGSTLTLSSSVILAGYYTVIDNGDGTYTITLNTTAFLEPGLYTINATVTYVGSRFENDALATFNLRVRFRAIVATSDPVGSVAWLEDISIVLHLTDGETANDVWNSTGGVNIVIAAQNATNPNLIGVSANWVIGSDTYNVLIVNTLDVGTYVILLNVSYDYTSPFYGFSIVQLSVTIRRHSTELQLSDPPERTGYGLNTTFELYYVDVDTSGSITTGSLNVVNGSLAGSWSIVHIAGGIYEVSVNTTAFSSIGTYWIEVTTQNTGPLANYNNATIYVRVFVRERYTLLTYDPVASVGYTDNVTVTLYFTDSESGNQGIANLTGSLTLTTNATTYYVSEGGAAGTYTVELPASQFTPFIFTGLTISMNHSGSPYYQNQTILIQFQVRGTSTDFAWDPSDPVPFGNQLNLTFYWGDADSGIPVDCALSVNVSITIESVTQPSLAVGDPMVLAVVQASDTATKARFFLLLNTSYLDGFGTYQFRISINWTNPNLAPYYEDQLDKLISVIIRVRDTAVPQVLAGSTFFGENVTVYLQYVDLDNSSQLVVGGSLDIQVLDGLSHWVNYTPSIDGFYEIEIVTEGTGLLGNVRLNLSVLWYGTPFFENQTSVSVLVNIGLRQAIMEVDYPSSTPYLDNVTFTIRLQDAGTLEYINNNESYISVSFVIPSILDIPDVTYVLASNGAYQIQFNSSVLGMIGSYTVLVVFDHSGSAPYYSIVQRNVTGVAAERVTSLDYDPISAVPYGNYMVFNVTYFDVDASPDSPIASGDLYLSCATSSEVLVVNTNYWYTYLGGGLYGVNISSTALGSPDTYDIVVTLNSTAEWWLSERTRSIAMRVDYRTVDLSADSPDVTYYDEITFFELTLTDLDNGSSGVGLEGMTAYISVIFVVPFGLDNSSVQIAELGSGLYNISFDTGILGALIDYEVDIVFEYGQQAFFFEASSDERVTGRVAARLTQLIYDIEGSTPFLSNITISVTYEDLVGSSGISGADLTVTSTDAVSPLIEGTSYWITDLGSGFYEVLVNSTVFDAIGQFTMEITAEHSGVPFYVNRTTSINVQVRERATRLTYSPPAETPYSDNVSVTVQYLDADAGLGGITAAENFMTLDEINGSAVDPSYYWIEVVSQGTYRILINSSKLSVYGQYNLTITITGMVTHHYEGQTVVVDCDIRARNTQLTTAPIPQAAYTQNITVTFYFTDRDADAGISNSTGGVLVGLNATGGWWVVQLAPGVYEMRINATDLGATGEFAFEATFDWVLGNPFYANQTLTFTVSVTGATAILSYTPPTIAPFGDNITFTVYYKDSATGNGISNGTGDVHITLVPLNSTASGPFAYSLTNPAPGEFVYTFNSTQWLATGSLYFQLNVTWTDGVVPYFPDINGTEIRAVVRTTFTQLFTGVPDPGTVPAGDNVTFSVTFFDLDRDAIIGGANISTDWAYGQLITYLGDGSFNVTLFTAGIPATGRLSVQVDVNKSYYASRTATASITVRNVNTLPSSTVPTPGVAPVGDNVTLHVGYYDTDHEFNITGASISTDWIYGWNWTLGPSGGFDIILYTDTVTNLIQYDITFTMTKALHIDGVVVVRVEIRSVQTAISIVPPGDTPAGNNVSVVVTVTDLDHGTYIDGANIISTSPSYSWVPLGNGQYNITFYLWDQSFGTYTYDITALATNHDPASLNVDINLRQTRTTLFTGQSLMIVNWSELVELAANYDQEEAPVGPVPGATVVATLSGTDTSMTFNGSAYVWNIDTSTIEVGTYIITIAANKTNFETRVLQVTLVVSILETEFETHAIDPETDEPTLSFDVSSGELIDIAVYYGSLSFGGVVGASVSYSWDLGQGPLVSNGTAGFYTTVLNTSGARYGTYTIYVFANMTNHAEASLPFSIFVREIDTVLAPIGQGSIDVMYGDNITLYVNFTTLVGAQSVSGANVTFTVVQTGYSGNLTELAPGEYYIVVNSADLHLPPPQTYELRVRAHKDGYALQFLTVFVNSLYIDSLLDDQTGTITIVYRNSTTFQLEYYDRHNNMGIENATLYYSWAGGEGYGVDIGNGSYIITVNSTAVRLPEDPYLEQRAYSIEVRANSTFYETERETLTLMIRPIQTSVSVDTSTIDDGVPIGDSAVVSLEFRDVSWNESIDGADGTVRWVSDSGVVFLNLTEVGDGVYSFVFPNYAELNPAHAVIITMFKQDYRLYTESVEIAVRRIRTNLTADPTIVRQIVQGANAEITVSYIDVDHGLPITGAEESLEITSSLAEDISFVIDSVTEVEPGQYLIKFRVPVAYLFTVTVTAPVGEYHALAIVEVNIDANPESVDMGALILQYTILGAAIIGLTGGLLWVRIFSVPKVIRWINGMVKKLRKGKVPDPAPVPGRNELILELINDGLAEIGLSKPLDEMPLETVTAEAPEVEPLLAELAEITGLEEEDVVALRTDLSRMKASERTGFLMEVIKQERARRAEAIAEKKKKKKKKKKEVVTEEDLEEIRQRLLKLGINKDEVEVLIEQAKSLSKADIEALLDQITGGMD